MGEGGAHRHGLESPTKTLNDGIHKHLFFVMDRLIMTLLDGAHWHPIVPSQNQVGAENIAHKHKIIINTEDGNVEFETSEGGEHMHELQTGGTTLSGLHQHTLEINGESFVSLLPGDLIEEIEQAAKTVKAFRDFKIKKSEDPMEMDFELIKRVNQNDFRSILKTAVERAQMKALSLGEGLQIESLILSRERFSDIGVARRFVMDHGLQVKASEEIPAEGVFTFQIRSRERFIDSTLQRVRISDGVEAVVGFINPETKAEDSEAPREPAQEGSGADAFTENASTPEPEAETAAASDVEQLGDSNKARHPDKKPKKTKKSATKKFVFLKTGKELEGSVADQLQKIADANNVERKFVTVEYPEKRFVEVLTTKYEVVSASYKNLGKGEIDDEGEGQEYESLHVKGENLEAFIVSPSGLDGYRKSLVIFFDDPDSLDEIFKTEVKNYEFGAYQFKMTMMGPVLVPVENDNTVEPILDEGLLKSLDRDTKVFFSEKSEKFFKENNLTYKRGVLMYGPPGNGKTTFIKYYAENHVDDGYAILCEAQDFDGCMGKFLKQRLGVDAKKVIIFEDVDAIAHSYHRRSEFLNFLDGVNTVNKSLFIATTNYPHALDDAIIKRPSRFDQKYFIGLPDEKMRTKFLNHFFKDADESHIHQAVQRTEGFTGAMFKEVFILTGLQDCSMEQAIEKMRDQMDIQKRKKKTKKEIDWLLFKQLVPADDASNEEKREAQRARAEQFGIEALEGKSESLTPRAGFSPDLEDWGDPVNFKFPIDTVARTRNAVARFGQGIGDYELESSTEVVANRIGERAESVGIEVSPDADIWGFLSSDLKDKFREMNEKGETMKDLKAKFDRVSKLYVPRKKKIANPGIQISKRAAMPKTQITFNILKKNLEKGLVTGPILIPDKVDLQGDIVDGEEIEKAIHNYMVKLAFQKDSNFLESIGLNAKSERGFMHNEFSRKIAFVEMFVVNDDRGFMMMNKEKVANGTAMGTAKIFDDEVKALVRAGKITGFSIGGRSKVIPLNDEE